MKLDLQNRKIHIIYREDDRYVHSVIDPSAFTLEGAWEAIWKTMLLTLEKEPKQL